jgi:hypothetical protein
MWTLLPHLPLAPTYPARVHSLALTARCGCPNTVLGWSRRTVTSTVGKEAWRASWGPMTAKCSTQSHQLVTISGRMAHSGQLNHPSIVGGAPCFMVETRNTLMAASAESTLSLSDLVELRRD